MHVWACGDLNFEIASEDWGQIKFVLRKPWYPEFSPDAICVFWVSSSFCLIYPVVAPTIPSDLTTQPPCQGKYQLQGTFDSPIGRSWIRCTSHFNAYATRFAVVKCNICQGLKCIQEYQMTSLDTKQLHITHLVSGRSISVETQPSGSQE